MSRIGAALYALRGDRTIVAFAESIDIHRVTYATWERGSRTPPTSRWSTWRNGWA